MKGSSVTSYHLQVQEVFSDETLGDWTDLIGYDEDNLAVKYTMATDLHKTSSYAFRVRCRNKWGWGLWSSSLLI